MIQVAKRQLECVDILNFFNRDKSDGASLQNARRIKKDTFLNFFEFHIKMHIIRKEEDTNDL
jgi:hypothetical protein